MGIRTFLSEDASSPPLNTEAHAVEHCAVDSESLGALGSAVGRQVLIRQASDRLALYTVVEPLSASARAAHVGTAGLARLGAAARPPRAQRPNATIDADFLGGDPEAVARLTEKLRGEAGARHARPARQAGAGLDRPRLQPRHRCPHVLAHAIAFHGNNDSEAIIVGGGLRETATTPSSRQRSRPGSTVRSRR
jgi:hypothetical protein